MLATKLKKYLNARLIGDDVEIIGINAIDLCQGGDVSFVVFPKDMKCARKTLASCLIMQIDDAAHYASDIPCSILVVEDIFLAFRQIFELKCFLKTSAHEQKIAPCAFVHEKSVIGKAHIGEKSQIAANVVIEDNVFIGNGCTIGPSSVIKSGNIIEDNVTIGSGSIIGARAFTPAGLEKLFLLPSFGSVIIEEGCSIGDLVSIAKGVMSATKVGKGCFIDNLVHIAHDTLLGQNVIIAAQTAVAGFVRIKDNVTIGGQVGIAPYVTIGRNVQINSKSGVHKDIDDFAVVSGNPAIPHMDYLRLQGRLKKFARERK